MTTARSVTVIIMFAVISGIIGLIREMLIASKFGMSMEADVYFIVLSLFSIITGIVVVAISTTLVPILVEIEAKEGREGKVRYLNNILNIVVVGFVLVAVLVFIFAPNIIRILAKGFEGEQLRLAIFLVRVGTPILVFSAVLHIFVSFLHSNGKFTAASAVGVPQNIILVFFLIFMSSIFGVKGLMIASIVAAASQFLLLISASLASGYRFKIGINLKDKYLKKNLALVVPVFFGIMAGRVNLIVDRTLASTLVIGSISALNYANKLNQLILSLFVVSIVTVLFPKLSKNVREGDYESFKTIMGKGINIIVLITLPIVIGAILLSKPIISFLFERGAFDAAATQMTSVALVFYSLGLMGIGVATLLQRVYFAMQDTKTPIVVGVISVIVNIALNLLLIGYLAHGGLALATSISTTLTAILLLACLKMKMSSINIARIIRTIIKSGFASAIMGIIVYYVFFFSSRLFHGTIMLDALALLIPVAIGALVYILICYALKVEEVRSFSSKLCSVTLSRVKMFFSN